MLWRLCISTAAEAIFGSVRGDRYGLRCSRAAFITRPDVTHLLTYFQLRAEKRVVAGTDYLNQAVSISPASI